jgi:hypothetical protein
MKDCAGCREFDELATIHVTQDVIRRLRAGLELGSELTGRLLLLAAYAATATSRIRA